MNEQFIRRRALLHQHFQPVEGTFMFATSKPFTMRPSQLSRIACDMNSRISFKSDLHARVRNARCEREMRRGNQRT